jgi:hypothetical protein
MSGSFSKVVFLDYHEYLRLKTCEEKLEKLLHERRLQTNKENESVAGEEMEGEGALAAVGVGPVPMSKAVPAEVPDPTPEPPPEIPILHKSLQPDNAEEIRQDNSWKQFVNSTPCSSKREFQLPMKDLSAVERPWYYVGLKFDSDDD